MNDDVMTLGLSELHWQVKKSRFVQHKTLEQEKQCRYHYSDKEGRMHIISIRLRVRWV